MSKNGSNKILISIIVFLILLIIGGGAAAFWYITKAPNKADSVQISKKQAVNTQDESLSEIGPLYPMKPITVNLKSTGGKDVYLKVTFSLELNNKILSHELDAKNAVIRDEIIRILSSKTLADIDSEFEKDKMCNDIKKSLNAILTDGQINNVYIVSFIIQ